MNSGLLKILGHALQRGPVDLRDAAFVNSQFFADFAHGLFTDVVEANHGLISVREGFHGGTQDRAQLTPPGEYVGIEIGLGREFGNGLIFVIGGEARGGEQAHHAQFHGHLAPSFEIHTHSFRDFLLSGRTLHDGGKFARNFFEFLVALAEIARGPVEIAETVEHGAFDAMFRVAFEGDLLVTVVFQCRVEEAENAGMNQIFQIDVNGKILVNANGNRAHERKMFQDEIVAGGVVGGWKSGFRCHGVWTDRLHGLSQRGLDVQALGRQLLRGILPMREGSRWFGMGRGNGTGGSVWNSTVEFEGDDGFGEQSEEEDEDGFQDQAMKPDAR